MEIKDQFIRALIDELNNVNQSERIGEEASPLDVCYIVSVVDQQIEQHHEFMETISKYRFHINGYEEDHSGGYTNGEISILIEKPDEEKQSDYCHDAYYDYEFIISFGFDERYWGYCQCEPGDHGYEVEHNCCGNGCDWTAPSFHITKAIRRGGGSWNGSEKDYWKYKRKFNENELNKNREVEELKKKQEREHIEKQIQSLQDKLKLL
ncbi:hypothetical protein [Paenibacillus lautus]|uniref:hypothetical protein n=1 Tax=Paenibacillus lautus TaxID=1401 RepID=UPI001C7CA5C6|nr:hypothetical protein [Paenibacillus lautus]MBX4152376.1 hypothetical protein [Paenibacillus lautus]